MPAQVLDVSVDDGGEHGPTSTVTVRFKPRGDDPSKRTVDLSYDGDFVEDHPDAARAGARVEYDPHDPEHARLVGESEGAGDRLVGGIVGLVVVAAFTFVLVRRPDLWW